MLKVQFYKKKFRSVWYSDYEFQFAKFKRDIIIYQKITKLKRKKALHIYNKQNTRRQIEKFSRSLSFCYNFMSVFIYARCIRI